MSLARTAREDRATPAGRDREEVLNSRVIADGTVPAYVLAEVKAIVHTDRIWIGLAGTALVASLVGTSGLANPAGSSLLLAFGALVALSLTRQGPR